MSLKKRVKKLLLRARRYLYIYKEVLKHPKTPWFAKAVVGVTLFYLVNPFDLIPDFIPIFGQLDDLIIIPLGVWLSFKLVPKEIWKECRKKADRKIKRGFYTIENDK